MIIGTRINAKETTELRIIKGERKIGRMAVHNPIEGLTFLVSGVSTVNLTGYSSGNPGKKNSTVECSVESILQMVGATGFEPTTPCAQGRCATKLRYAPIKVTKNSIP